MLTYICGTERDQMIQTIEAPHLLTIRGKKNAVMHFNGLCNTEKGGMILCMICPATYAEWLACRRLQSKVYFPLTCGMGTGSGKVCVKIESEKPRLLFMFRVRLRHRGIRSVRVEDGDLMNPMATHHL